MTVILGIDPGSRRTGFGVIEVNGSQQCYVTSGIIRLDAADIPSRLNTIFDGVSEIIRQHKPEQVAVEQVFMAQNPGSALKLGQARGAAVVACVQQQVEVYEFSARQIKQSVVGTGAAAKEQVQHMVMSILKLSAPPAEDAADALAAALCCANTQASLANMKTESTADEGWRGAKLRRGRLRF